MTDALTAISFGLIMLRDRAWIACVCMKEIRGTGTCSTRDNTLEAALGQLDASTLTVLAIIAIGIIIVCASTLYFVKRDGFGPRPTRDDYDTRRPEP